MAKRTGLDGLADAIGDILAEYSDEIARGTKECVQKAARAGVKALKETSPRRPNGGGYAKGWTAEVKEGRLGAKATLHNKTKPGLVHLLEHGHEPSTPPHVHVAPVEQQLITDFSRDVLEVIET